MMQNFIPAHISKENKNINLKSYMYPNVPSSIIYNWQGMEATLAPINR